MTPKEIEIVSRYLDCLPILINFIKDMEEYADEEVRDTATRTLKAWDEARRERGI